MIYFRAGCIALFFITIPALASEVRDVPEGNRVFWFVVFPVTFLMFPVLFGALFSGIISLKNTLSLQCQF
jgi:hypothetical protein